MQTRPQSKSQNTRSEVTPPRETRQSQHRLAILNGPSSEIQLLHLSNKTYVKLLGSLFPKNKTEIYFK
jgi:hypothetical protein